MIFEDKNIKKSYHLKNLFLDPNNYRFLDNDSYYKVDENLITDERIQKRTRSFLEGKNKENLRDLLDSFMSNGYLEVDIIQVADLGNNRYLVLEGNRRVAALKILQEYYDSGLEIGKLDHSIFKSVPFEIHENSDKNKHLIIMGLKHISGNKKWAPINQAKLIYDYLKQYEGDDYWEEEKKLCMSLGITKVALRTSQRAYHLILKYKQSDYGDQFKSEMFSLFVEIIKRPVIKEWLGWNDSNYSACNIKNLERIFSWISNTNDLDENEEEAIITKTVEIKDLSNFINNEEAIEEMEKTRSITRAMLKNGNFEKEHYEKAILNLQENLESISRYKDFLEYDKIEEISSKFNEILPQKRNIEFVKSNVSLYFECKLESHFKKITVENYKIFKDFNFEKLNRINLIVGKNNTGKTSLLEAIFLLSKQNDISSFLNLLKLKNKFSDFNYEWLNKIFIDNISISGVFSDVTTHLNIEKFETDDKVDKKEDYLASYKMSAITDGNIQETIIHTFKYNELQRENKKIRNLCSCIIKSPYYYNLEEVVETYNEAVEKKINNKSCLELVVDYMKKIDCKIKGVQLTTESNIKRFVVDYDDNSNKNNLDITNYGEGIQRLFEIALSFAYAKNGVICIDEFETSFHYGLLEDFTKFIQELAIKFNVQVFITTHSKECVDAFVKNGYRNNDISAFLLKNLENKISTVYIGGERLLELIDTIDLDIRGDK